MKGFLDFIRKQGVVGLAVGFILGGAVSDLVGSLVNDIINPLLGIVLGVAKGLENAVVKLGPAEIKLGNFLGALIDFGVIALVVYYGVKALDIKKLNIKKKIKIK